MWDLVSCQIEAVSVLTYSEQAIILASIEAVLEPKLYHCATCIMQYGASERMQGKAERKRISKGCYDLKTKSYRLENIRYNNCIGNHTVPLEYLMDSFVLYEKGTMPFEGTLGDQPNKIIEIFEVIHRRRREYNKRNEKK